MRSLDALGTLAAVLLIAGAAQANDPAQYHLRGRDADGTPFRGLVTIDPNAQGALRLEGTVAGSSLLSGRPAVTGRSTGTDQWTFDLGATETRPAGPIRRGMRGALAGEGTSTPASTPKESSGRVLLLKKTASGGYAGTLQENGKPAGSVELRAAKPTRLGVQVYDAATKQLLSDAKVAVARKDAYTSDQAHWPFGDLKATHTHRDGAHRAPAADPLLAGDYLLVVSRPGKNPVVQRFGLKVDGAHLKLSVKQRALTVARPRERGEQEGDIRRLTLKVRLFAANEIVYMSGTDYDHPKHPTRFQVFAERCRNARRADRALDEGALATILSCDGGQRFTAVPGQSGKWLIVGQETFDQRVLIRDTSDLPVRSVCHPNPAQIRVVMDRLLERYQTLYQGNGSVAARVLDPKNYSGCAHVVNLKKFLQRILGFTKGFSHSGAAKVALRATLTRSGRLRCALLDTAPKQKPKAKVSITDLYDYVHRAGQRAPGSVSEVSIFSHSYPGGPILYNTYDRSGGAGRDPSDLDGRKKDWTHAMSAFPHLKSALGKSAFLKVWGCSATSRYKALQGGALLALRQKRDPHALFDVRYGWESHGSKTWYYFTEAASLAQTRHTITRAFLSGSYMQVAVNALGIQVYGSPPGVGSSYGGRTGMYIQTKSYAQVYGYMNHLFGKEAAKPDAEGYLEYRRLGRVVTSDPNFRGQPTWDTGRHLTKSAWKNGEGQPNQFLLKLPTEGELILRLPGADRVPAAYRTRHGKVDVAAIRDPAPGVLGQGHRYVLSDTAVDGYQAYHDGTFRLFLRPAAGSSTAVFVRDDGKVFLLRANGSGWSLDTRTLTGLTWNATKKAYVKNGKTFSSLNGVLHSVSAAYRDM